MTTGKKILITVGGALLFVGLCVALLIGIAVYSITSATHVETRVSKYDAKYQDWQATGLINHFPAKIPAQASDIRFSTTPGFLQGGGHFQLHVVLPAPDVQALIQAMHGQAKHIYPGGGGFFSQVNANNGVATATYHTAPSPSVYEFPSDFTFYVLHSADSTGGPNPSWNHGASYGVAINPVKNQVVYWAEQW